MHFRTRGEHGASRKDNSAHVQRFRTNWLCAECALSGSDPVTAECCRVSLPSASLSALCSFTQKKKKKQLLHTHTFPFAADIVTKIVLLPPNSRPCRADRFHSPNFSTLHHADTLRTRGGEEQHCYAHPELEESWKKKKQAEPPTTPAFGCTSATLKDLTRAQKCHINTFRGAALSGARR